MAKIKPLVMSFDNAQALDSMKAEYEFIGREVDADYRELKLVVRSLPRKFKKKQTHDAKLARNRADSDGEVEDFSY